MIHVDSVGQRSNTVRREERLLPGGAYRSPGDLPPNVVYDPRAILAHPYAGCRAAQLKGVMVTYDNILSPEAPIDHITAEDAPKRRVRP